MTQGKEVEGKRLDIEMKDGKSDLSVEDHPIEPLEYHKPSQEERNEQLDTQIRTARIEHHSCPDMNQSEEVESKHLYRDATWRIRPFGKRSSC